MVEKEIFKALINLVHSGAWFGDTSVCEDTPPYLTVELHGGLASKLVPCQVRVVGGCHIVVREGMVHVLWE